MIRQMVKVVYLLLKTRPDAEVNEVLNSRWSELIIVNGYFYVFDIVRS